MHIGKSLALAGALFLAAGASAALAHHGWGWASPAESRLAGTIESIFLGNPHAHLQVAAEGGSWEVDLAPPAATQRAGIKEGFAKAGDRAAFTGHRSRDPEERVFKAETVTVNGQTYDVYPSREKSLQPQS